MLSLDTLELPSESLKDQDDEPTLRGTCSDIWSQWWPFRKAILPCLEEKQGQSTNHFILCFLWTFQQHTEESLVHKGSNTKLFSGNLQVTWVSEFMFHRRWAIHSCMSHHQSKQYKNLDHQNPKILNSYLKSWEDIVII